MKDHEPIGVRRLAVRFEIKGTSMINKSNKGSSPIVAPQTPPAKPSRTEAPTSSAVAPSKSVSWSAKSPEAAAAPSNESHFKMPNVKIGEKGLVLGSTGTPSSNAVPVNANWTGMFQNAQVVKGGEIKDIEGKLPEYLKGSLVQAGPGLFEAGGERVSNFIAALGSLAKINFSGGENGKATLDQQFIETPELKKALAEDKLPTAIGHLSEGNMLERSVANLSNAANVSIRTYENEKGERRAFIHNEASKPVEYDVDKMKTIGETNIGGLKKGKLLGEAYTAHTHSHREPGQPPKFYGVSMQNALGKARLHELDSAGQIVRSAPAPGLRIPLPHDFMTVGKYIVFVQTPVKMSPMKGALGLEPLTEAMKKDPNGKTAIHVFDRNTFEPIASAESDAFNVAGHFNQPKLEKDGTLSFVCFKTPNDGAATPQLTANVTSGKAEDLAGIPTRIHINPETGKVVKSVQLADIKAEVPQDDYSGNGNFWCATQTGQTGFFNGYAQMNRETGLLEKVQLPEGVYGNEPSIVTDPNDPKKRCLVSTQYDSTKNKGLLVVYDADKLSAPPLYRGELPAVIPARVHAEFLSSKSE
jgi:all-trans-8'-apo-beta-carotenal 15,15'-oxygenase